ncbi:MAG: hypothetical protein RL088_3443 [Verrucomicrobiota bacterium]|jgi:hypothetical protein
MIERKLTDSLLMDIRDIARRIEKRLERGEGSGAPCGFSDAKREEEPRGAEGLPQSLAVSPVEARQHIEDMIEFFESEAADYLNDAAWREWIPGFQNGVAVRKKQAAIVRCWIETLTSMLPKPESEQGENAGDGKQSKESPEASATPSNGTASGRRNAEPTHPEPKP